MDPRAPQRLIRIDVAHSGDEALIEQSRLDARARGGESRGEGFHAERVGQRFRPERRERRGRACVVAGVDHGDTSEPSRVAEDQGLAVIELQPDSHMLPIRVDEAGRVVVGEHAKDPGHPEMHDQLGRRLRTRPSEWKEEELAASLDARDPSADGARDRSDAPCRVGVPLRRDDGASGHERSQLAPHGLDLGELRHAARVLVRPSLPSPKSSWEATVSEPPHGPSDGRTGAVGRRDRREDGRPEQTRPRDRTGRPLPYGTSGVSLVEQVEPDTLEEALALGVTRWGERRYFEAHELLELLWKQGPEEQRDLWKGVIQVAVAGVHLQRGNPMGARRLLDRALGRLDTVPDVRCGIDVAALRRTAERARTRLDAGELPDADWGAFPAVPDGPTVAS